MLNYPQVIFLWVTYIKHLSTTVIFLCGFEVNLLIHLNKGILIVAQYVNLLTSNTYEPILFYKVKLFTDIFQKIKNTQNNKICHIRGLFLFPYYTYYISVQF